MSALALLEREESKEASRFPYGHTTTRRRRAGSARSIGEPVVVVDAGNQTLESKGLAKFHGARHGSQ